MDNEKKWRKYYKYQPRVKEKLYYCIELGLTFKTSTAAMEALGIDNSSLIKACKGIRKSAGKHPETNEPLHWKYVDINGNDYIEKEKKENES